MALLLAGCGDNTAVIDIDLPIDQASPFVELNQGTGSVFFQFDPLQNNPTSINDLDGSKTGVQFPKEQPFLQPDKSSYDISEINLDDDTFYRVTLFGILSPTDTVAKYKGVGDCPLKKSLGASNLVHVCFGLATGTPICPDQVKFDDCPR
jgi:hypothetical protein